MTMKQTTTWDCDMCEVYTLKVDRTYRQGSAALDFLKSQGWSVHGGGRGLFDENRKHMCRKCTDMPGWWVTEDSTDAMRARLTEKMRLMSQGPGKV